MSPPKRIGADTKLADVWRDLPGAIGVYTAQTSHRIPNEAGIYAWYLPLKLDGTPDALQHLFERARHVHSANGSGTASTKIGWDTLELDVSRRLPALELPAGIDDEHRRLKLVDKQWAMLRRYLLLASLITPPLYVGKATSLQDRYTQHVRGISSDLAARLKAQADSSTEEWEKVSVDSLLFLTISMPPFEDDDATAQQYNNPPHNRLVEYLLNRLARPAYGRV